MILELKQLNKRFDKPVLKDINLEIEQGQIISILGKERKREIHTAEHYRRV